jgi:hypothetical protein
MIPHRLFVSAPLANELRERVSACRKRLRENRIARVQTAVEFRDGQQAVTLVDESDRTERLRRLELEEVGIT